MSEIAKKTKYDIQLCNYHLKKMVSDNIIRCIEKEGVRLYTAYDIVNKSTLYIELFELITQHISEFYTETKDKKVMAECIRQVLLQVMNDIDLDQKNTIK